MDGVLVIDKPWGPTSHDVVARVRRALKIRRVGHTGTLDPIATGVLPLVVGRATRLASLLSAGTKTYEAGVRLGCATESYDAAERIAKGLPPPPPPDVSAGDVESVLERFRGSFLQTPPAYSAKKIGGVAAHRLARRQKTVQPRPAPVTVFQLQLLSFGPGIVQLRITASAGFYVRSLAHDIGQALGCGAHLESLRRTQAGDFGLEAATTLQTVEDEGRKAVERITPMEKLLPDVPAVRLTTEGARRAGHGNDIRVIDLASAAAPSATPGGRVRLLDEGGRLLAIATATSRGVLRPAVVLV